MVLSLNRVTLESNLAGNSEVFNRNKLAKFILLCKGIVSKIVII